MKKLSYVHYSINAKAGIDIQDVYGNPIFVKPKEANEYGKDVANDTTESGNEAADLHLFLGTFDRSTTKIERKKAEHDYREMFYNDATFGNEDYGQ